MTGGRGFGIVVILVSTLAESTGQLSWKRAVRRSSPTAGPVASAFAHWPWLLLGVLGFAADGYLWSVALKLLDVTVAHPIGSLVFVVTALLSRLILRERIPPRRWAGIGLILAGSVCVAVG